MEHRQAQYVETQYTQTVLDHGTNPRHMGFLKDPDGFARIKGPCGDTMEIFLKISHDRQIKEAAFWTDGCITSIASGSMTVALAEGNSVQSARKISQSHILDELGGLPEESQHCALLAANTLRAAINDYALTQSDPWKRQYRRR